MTYRKAGELGGQVKRGAKSESAFYVGSVTRTVENREGELEDSRIAFMKAYAVFNADEIENLPEQYRIRAAAPRVNPGERDETVDAWVTATGATIHHGGGRCFYRHAPADEIHMAPFESFEGTGSYYSTLCHELTHWSGAAHRLDRTKGKIFGDENYAFEELIAELGAAYLCADLRVTADVREDHASYIKSWLKALRDDSRNIFRAASHAERACGFLHAFSKPAADAPDMAEAA
jgi:antirestriction protein ArdC